MFLIKPLRCKRPFSAGINPCASFHPITGYHSDSNPFLCATMFDPPTCGGLAVNNDHVLSYRHCPSGVCGDTVSGSGSTSHFIMYMQVRFRCLFSLLQKFLQRRDLIRSTPQ